MPARNVKPAKIAKTHSRAHLHIATRGERVADQVAAFVGSWPFVIGQAALLALWMAWNAIGPLFLRYDAFPFVFLNLFMSAEAAFATPIILMAQNRQSAIDRRRDDHEAAEVDQLFTINKQQLEILRILRQMQAEPHAEPHSEPVAGALAQSVASVKSRRSRAHKAAVVAE